MSEWRHRPGYVQPDEPEPDWQAIAETQRLRAEAAEAALATMEMAVWRYEASRNLPEGREGRWLNVLAAMGVCRECRHVHAETVCYVNVGGPSPEPCLCDNDPREALRAADRGTP